MRFLELRLTACGPFTQHSLDLSGGERGLHLIYGPNEAGKSSTLRAIGYLLFGFPPQHDDDFLHPYPSLRVGARLENDRGEELNVIRRKAAKNSLRGGDDGEILNEDELRGFCGYIDEERFRNFFGIDHQRMVEGGQAIAAGGGDLGQILFTGGGVRDLKAVLDGLEAEAKEIFNAKARNPRINKRLAELNDARRRIKENQLSAAEWAEHRAALESAQARKQAAEAELQAKTRECSRLDRIRKALPLFAELNDRRTDLAALADAPLLPPDFASRRHKIESDLRLAVNEHERLAAGIEACRSELAALKHSPELLAQRTAIEQLSSDLSVYRQAESDRPAVESSLAQSEEAARAILSRLGLPADLAAVDELAVPEAKRLRIRALSSEFALVCKELRDAAAAIAELERERDDAEHELKKLPVAREVGSLATAVQDALRLGDAEEQRLATMRSLESLAAEAEAKLRRLPLWSGSLTELESLAAPLAETIDRFENELAAVAQKQAVLTAEGAERQEESRRLQQEIDVLRLQFEPLTEADLQHARREREEAWQAVREAWREGAKPTEPEHILFALSDGLGGLADTFERKTATADEIADRLRRESERVAKHLQLLKQQEACRERQAAIASELTEVAARHAAIAVEWKGIWAALASEPLSPREMRGWLAQRSELVRVAEEQLRERTRLVQIEARIEEQRLKLTSAIREATAAPIADRASLAHLIAAAQQMLEIAADTRRQWDRVEGEVRRIERARRAAVGRLAVAEEKDAAWRKQWAAAVEGFPVEDSSTPSEAVGILDLLAELSQHVRDAKGLRLRIDQMNNHAVQLDHSLRRLSTQIAPDLLSLPIAEAASKLANRLADALREDEKRADRSRRIEADQTQLQLVAGTTAQLQTALAALCGEAGCQSPGDLPAAEERSARRRSIAGEIDSLERRLRELSGGEGLEAFIAEAKTVDPDALALGIEQLDEQITALDREKDALGPEIGRQQAMLAQMDSGSQAADAAEQLEDLLARIDADAEEYARLRVALAALRGGVARYRERHQGPICRRAGQLFSRLTLGAYAELRADYDDAGKPELVGIRAPDQKVIRISQMSDGTADQLYLAVRLAWLEEYLEEHESVPFIVDDVLVQFDNERSIVALELLADLSRRTQVIFFTHHRHLVDLAEQSLEPELLFIHELADKPAIDPAVGV